MQTCQCADGPSVCLRDTGECVSGGCKPGRAGPSCQGKCIDLVDAINFYIFILAPLPPLFIHNLLYLTIIIITSQTFFWHF